jgi:dihydroneopterin aldolase
MIATIFIESLKVEAIIGVYEQERTLKQPLIIDIEMQYDAQKASFSDNLTYALDYHALSEDIHAFVEASSYQLIEALAQAIAQRILSNPIVTAVDLKLSKPQALDKAENVGIRISR